MDDDTGGLLQDEDLRVLEDNGQRGGLRNELLGGGGRDFHLDALAAREPCRGLPDRAVDADAAGLDQRPEPHPGELRQPVGEPTVESHARRGTIDGERGAPWSGGRRPPPRGGRARPPRRRLASRVTPTGGAGSGSLNARPCPPP